MIAKQTAVEVGNISADSRSVSFAALLAHNLPKRTQLWLECRLVCHRPLEKMLETFVRQQPDILGEHAEQDAHQE